MVAAAEIQRVVDQIAERFRPDRIILFGSHAYGKPDKCSDVDLLVILEFDGRQSDKAAEIWGEIRPEFGVDLIVRRPEDTARRYKLGDRLIGEALDRGVVLYERSGAGVDR